jgi:hypothetical protein
MGRGVDPEVADLAASLERLDFEFALSRLDRLITEFE